MGEKLKRLRLRAGLTQRELAEAMHVTQGAVYQWEKGLKRPRVGHLKALADFFGATVDFLIDE